MITDKDKVERKTKVSGYIVLLFKTDTSDISSSSSR